MKKQLSNLLIFVSLLGATGNALADVPETISYQGYLTDSTDAPVQGAQDVTFKLYDTSGVEIWTEAHQLTVINGVFEATLGSLQALPDALQQGTSLGISFGTNVEMTPRQTLNSTPFAIHAKTTEKDTLNSLTCTADQIPKWSGTDWNCSDDQLGQTGGVQAITTGSGLSSTGTDTVNISLDTAGIVASHIADGQVVKGLTVNGNALKDNVTLNAGSSISFSQSGNTVTINGETSGPASIVTTSGLTGGGSTGDVTVGIASGGVQAPMIADGQVVKGLIVGASQLEDIVILEAGTGVTLVPTGNTVVISQSLSGDQTYTGTKTFADLVNFNDDIELYNDGADAITFRKVDGSSYGEIGLDDSPDGIINWYFDLKAGASRFLFDDDVYIGRPRSGTNWSGGGELTVVNEINAYDDLEFYKRNNAPAELVTYTGRIFGNGNGIAIWPDNAEDYGVNIKGLYASSNSNDEYMRLGNYIKFTEGNSFGGDLDIYLGTSSDKLLKVRGNLEVTGSASKPGGGSWLSSSDRRMKKNIIPMIPMYALDKLARLNPVKYEWINPSEHGNKAQEYGFIAQELEQVFPSWVKEIEPKGQDNNLIPEKAKAIEFPHEFNAFVVSSLQELKKQNELLKSIVCEDHPEKEFCQ